MPRLTIHFLKNCSPRRVLDGFYSLRRVVATAITYGSLYIFGSDVTWNELRDESFISSKHTDRTLPKGADLDLILGEAKDCLKTAQARRDGITDKCKTLLTLSSLLLAIVGILYPKTSFGSLVTQLLFLASLLALSNARYIAGGFSSGCVEKCISKLNSKTSISIKIV